MTQKTVNEGEFYRHFKGQIYHIRALATNSVDNTPVVVYQAMYPPFKTWVSPFSTFLEKIDKEKYPDAVQNFRFEKVNFDNEKSDNIKPDTADIMTDAVLTPDAYAKTASVTYTESSAADTKQSDAFISVSDEEITDALLSGQVESRLSGKISDKQLALKGLMSFLDAQNFHDKRRIFISLRPYLNDMLLNNIAVTLDLVLDNGSPEQHFDTILNYLETHEHYECNRLR
ncbi:DUF1653 domain-containing protein [Eubacterium sp. MSJ-13]|uniref:DUF1653 domain-containing protein n=1 Tax=Eubacterium sp. MSJ-13 TaxID=2841513 RepID=UPI001C110DD1|nr:DUF1653 domain-containing protein [Eubacterium sp. MSJ-13]MBU5478848.1 DUF1653 domain-containing protein [Eubacterium sp. MSJ-13]